MLISSTGTLVRTPVRDISIVGRNTQGVRLIRLAEGERLTGIERVEGLENGDGDVIEAPMPAQRRRTDRRGQQSSGTAD